MDFKKSSHSVNIICSGTELYSFVSHLSQALGRRGISVSVFADADVRKHETDSFPDDQNHVATVSVMVFSETYKSSIPWFARHLEGHKNKGYEVVPVFYGVDSSVVKSDLECPTTPPEDGILTRHQSSSDSELVKEIVRVVHGKLSYTERIGTYSRLLEIENLICQQPWDVRSLGIWGMPGIGKTTIAEAVFDQIHSDYYASCFIEKFDEGLSEGKPQRLLKEKILSIVIKKLDVSSTYTTRLSLLRDKLRDTRILLVLDDVRNPVAAESFLGRLDWFGPGSLIIITSIYKQVFALCQVNQIYKVQGLNKQEAMQLFSQTAFGKDVPEKDDDLELSKKVIHYANGNPLALRIYGQELLKGKKSEMEAGFLRLKQRPPQKIQDMLKTVYSTLGENEKQIFLSIACFFKGENVDYVVELLKGCGYFPRVGIDILVDKCMLDISENILQMNDLIQDIFRHIMAEDKMQKKKRTTLWQPSSIRYEDDDELKGDDQLNETPKCLMVTKNIQGISLDTSNVMFTVNSDAVKDMTSLRFLKIYNSHSKNAPGLKFPEGKFLLSKLRVLHWENYPFKSLPETFDLQELVKLNMPNSKLKEFRTITENLQKLKMVDLRHSLELLEFSIHEYAQNIEMIDLRGCSKLEGFPAVTKLQNLQVLNLSGCSNIKTVPGLPPNIKELYLEGTSIEELPKSVVASVENTDQESVSSYNQGFCKLVRLDMKDCLHLRSLPDMWNLESLRFLNLSGCSSLDEIKGLPRNMKELHLAGTRIQKLPEFPECLEVLNAHDCYQLKSVHLDFKQLPRHYTFSNCFSLSLETAAEFLEEGLTRVIGLAKEENQEHINKAPALNMCFPADKYYSTFFHWREGSCVTVELTPRTQKTLLGFAMSVLVSFQKNSPNAVGLGIRCICTWGTKKGHFGKIERVFKCWTPTEAPRVEKDHMFVFYDSEIYPDAGEQTDSDDEIKFEFDTVSGENKPLGDTSCMVKGCGVKEITTLEVDKPVSGYTRGSEDICSIEQEDTVATDEASFGAPEEHKYLQQTPAATSSSSPSSINSHKQQVKSNGNGIRKLIACFWPKNSKSRKRPTRVLQESKEKGKIKLVDDADQIKHVHPPRHSICSDCRSVMSVSASDPDLLYPDSDFTSPHQHSCCINCHKPIDTHMVGKMQRSSVQLEPVESITE